MSDHARDTDQEIAIENDIIEGSRGLVLRLCHEVDPEVEVTLTPYLWHGDAVLDIGLGLHGNRHHLQVTADRLQIVWNDHEILKHDIEEAVHDLHRHGREHTVDESPFEVDHSLPDAVDAFAEAGGIEQPPPVQPVAPGVAVPEQPAAPAHAPAMPESIERPRREPGDTLDPEDRGTIERAIHLVHHLMEELAPEAKVAFEEYHWHGELALDIAITLHGHTHHYEVTVERARLFLEDHDMLHHDLEGVIAELQRS